VHLSHSSDSSRHCHYDVEPNLVFYVELAINSKSLRPYPLSEFFSESVSVIFATEHLGQTGTLGSGDNGQDLVFDFNLPHLQFWLELQREEVSIKIQMASPPWRIRCRPS
jgi:hypothetical protein